MKSASAKGTGAKVVVLALDDPDFESTKPVEKWSSVEFLATKSNLKFRAAVQVARVQGKQSMTTKLGVLMRQVASKSCDLSDLTQNPEGLKKELESAKTVACTLDQECMQAKKNTYEELRTRLESGTELIDELKTRFDEVEAALQFKLTEAGKNSQKEYQSNFWQLTRSSKHLEKRWPLRRRGETQGQVNLAVQSCSGEGGGKFRLDDAHTRGRRKESYARAVRHHEGCLLLRSAWRGGRWATS